MGFSRQEHWSGSPCLSPGDLLDPGIEPPSLMSPSLAGGFFTTKATWDGPDNLGAFGAFEWFILDGLSLGTSKTWAFSPWS